MKALTLISTALAAAFMVSCSSEAPRTVGDTGAEAYLDQTTFIVDGFEVYDHANQTSNELTTQFDSIYLTFNQDMLYITKVLRASSAGSQGYYYYDSVAVEFAGGLFKGVWQDAYHYMETVGFERRGELAGFEWSGQGANGSDVSKYIQMRRLDYHPASARVVSGLPE